MNFAMYKTLEQDLKNYRVLQRGYLGYHKNKNPIDCFLNSAISRKIRLPMQNTPN